MSIWDDVNDGISNDVVGDTRECYSGAKHNVPMSAFIKEENGEFFPASSMDALTEAFPAGLDQEMPQQKISATDLTITAIENDGQIIGIRISGIHGGRPEENFHTNMRIEEDGEDILLYDKEWAAIHETELDMGKRH